MSDTLSFRKYLSAQLNDPANRKGVRTRIRLMMAAVETLDEIPYQDMRVTDICTRIGVSHGLFYHHFNDKQAICETITTEFMRFMVSQLGETKDIEDPYSKLYVANHHYIESFRLNPGLWRTVLSNMDDLPELKAMITGEVTFGWHSRIASTVSKTVAGQKLSDSDRLLVGYSLGGMADELLRQVFVLKNPHLKEFRLKKSSHKLTELLSVVWYRATFGEDPKPSAMKKAQQLV